MAKCVVLLDNSNIFIEGQKFSALQKGVLKAHPEDRSPQDPSWRINFDALLNHLAEGREIHKAILVGSRPPPNDLVWSSAHRHGFEVIVYDRDSNNREKAVDTELVVQGTEIIVSSDEPMDLVIASGDRDFIPLVKVAQRRNWTVEMSAFSSAFSPYGEMATTVNRVRALDEAFDKIGSCSFEWPIPATEAS